MAAARQRNADLTRRRRRSQEVIAKIREDGALPSRATIQHPKRTKPEPADAKALASLKLGEAPLPASMRAWLAFDAKWLPLDIAKTHVRPKTFVELVAERLPEIVEYIEASGATLLPGPCYPLLTPTECNESAILFVYDGPKARDADGEPPVLGLDIQDEPMIGVYGAGFDLYLARLCDVVPSPGYAIGAGPRGYEEAGKAAFARVIGKKWMKSAYEDTIALSCIEA